MLPVVDATTDLLQVATELIVEEAGLATVAQLWVAAVAFELYQSLLLAVSGTSAVAGSLQTILQACAHHGVLAVSLRRGRLGALDLRKGQVEYYRTDLWSKLGSDLAVQCALNHSDRGNPFVPWCSRCVRICWQFRRTSIF